MKCPGCGTPCLDEVGPDGIYEHGPFAFRAPPHTPSRCAAASGAIPLSRVREIVEGRRDEFDEGPEYTNGWRDACDSLLAALDREGGE